MIKIGDKVYYWQTINRIGTVIEVITDSTGNTMTVGGTTTTRVFYKIQYEDGINVILPSGEVMKHFD